MKYQRDFKTLHSAVTYLIFQHLNPAMGFLRRGGEWTFGSTDLALKSERIKDFCGKSSRFADFEITVGRG